MRFCRCLAPSLLLFVLAAFAAPSPAHSATTGPPTQDSLQITLGRAAASLYGPWKFTVGDSPLDPKTGQPLWAEPGFDDSRWETVDLTPTSGAQNPITGVAGYVPGWTKRGHRGYWGYAWYRIRIHIDAEPGVRFAVAGPSIDDAYQLYDNGQLAGHFGSFLPHGHLLYYSQPVLIDLPTVAPDSSGRSTQVLAFRVWMQASTLYQGSGVGGFESAPVIGEASTIALVYHSLRDQLTRVYLWQPIEAGLFTLLGLLALSLFFFDRSDRVYLWIGALLLIAAIDATSGSFAVWTTWIDSRYDVVSHNFVLAALEYAGWVMIWRLWFRQRRPVWMPWALIPMVIALGISQAFNENFFPSFASGPASAIGYATSLALRLIMAGFLLSIVFRGIREQGLEGWLALPPILLESIAEFSHQIQQLGLRAVWFPFGIQINLAVASRLLLVVALTILLVRRLILSLRQQRILALDIKQAQEVQRVILPEARTVLPGIVVESEYRPAREVGGDFFQVIPGSADNSLLIVAGDVAGKGMQAGMLVALLVGAIRSTAESTRDPLPLLEALNRRLLGRGEAFATCIALRIASDGAVSLANAGHVPPYLNGEPIALEGALPLGALDGAAFSVARFQLQLGDRLTLTSDGLAEAQNPQRQLFGFPRVQELIKAGQTAVQLADTIQSFGQEDDISIVTVTRVPILDPVPA